jgi:hypothetical protein
LPEKNVITNIIKIVFWFSVSGEDDKVGGVSVRKGSVNR